MVKFHPVGNRLVVELDDITGRTYGSLVLPDTGKELVRTGVIIAAGEKVKDFKVGDHVGFSSYSGVNVHMPKYGIVDDGKYRVLTEDEILFRIEISEG